MGDCLYNLLEKCLKKRIGSSSVFSFRASQRTNAPPAKVRSCHSHSSKKKESGIHNGNATHYLIIDSWLIAIVTGLRVSLVQKQ